MKSNFIDPVVISEELDLPRRRVMALIKKGLLQAYRFGPDYRVKSEDLSLFIQAAKIEGE